MKKFAVGIFDGIVFRHQEHFPANPVKFLPNFIVQSRRGICQRTFPSRLFLVLPYLFLGSPVRHKNCRNLASLPPQDQSALDFTLPGQTFISFKSGAHILDEISQVIFLKRTSSFLDQRFDQFQIFPSAPDFRFRCFSELQF